MPVITWAVLRCRRGQENRDTVGIKRSLCGFALQRGFNLLFTCQPLGFTAAATLNGLKRFRIQRRVEGRRRAGSGDLDVTANCACVDESSAMCGVPEDAA